MGEVGHGKEEGPAGVAVIMEAQWLVGMSHG